MTEVDRRFVLASGGGLALFPGLGRAQAPELDEFYGPLPGWLDARRDFGAVGDGRADDTAALQRALAALTAAGEAVALYLPAGRYRITRTLSLPRKGVREARGTTIVGEDPLKTVLVWDGAAGERMLDYGAWYATLGRLTFDGAGRAGIGVAHGPEFVTANEFLDCVFQNLGLGIEAGKMETAGIAETSVMRCRFYRCDVGVKLRNFNSLDWWFWRCRFEDCGTALTNLDGAGNFHAYECVFLRSREADISIRNTGYLSFRDNLSIGSRAFFTARAADAGCQLTFQRNRIYDTTDVAAIRIANLGPASLIDNLIVSRPGQAGPAVQARSATGLAIGNRYSAPAGAALKAGAVVLDETVRAGRKTATIPPPAPFAKRFDGALVPVPTGASAGAIQGLIDGAVRKGGRAMLVFGAAAYELDRTLTVPAGVELRLVGQGIPYATRLRWSGQGSGPILRLRGPSRTRLYNLALGGAADGIELSGVDGTGAPVLLDQTKAVNASEAGYAFERLGRAQVAMRNVDHSGCRLGMRLIGRGTTAASAPLFILSGASSNDDLSYDLSEGARLIARDIWYETSFKPGFMRLSGAADFCLNGSNIAVPRKRGQPPVQIEGLNGRALFLGVIFTNLAEVDSMVEVSGGPASKVLLLGCQGSGEFFADRGGGRAARISGLQYANGGGARPIADRGQVDPAFVREMVALIRTPPPRDVAAVRLTRLYLEGCRTGIRVTA